MARFLSFGIRLFAIGLLIVPLACDRRTAAADELPPPSGDTVPCFPEWGTIAFTVNGVPVPEKTVNRFAAFYKDLGVQPEDKAKARAIDDAIVPTAVLYADYRDQQKLADWSRRVREVEARLKAGEDFAAVAKSASDCTTKQAGGDLGEPFRRDQNITPVTESGFRQNVGEVSPPIVTLYGAHFLKITGKIDGSSPERDQRKGAHILVAFDPDAIKDPSAYREKVQKLKKEAHVESVKDPYKKLIPAMYRR
jgi:PPIC-type PPIASE domain